CNPRCEHLPDVRHRHSRQGPISGDRQGDSQVAMAPATRLAPPDDDGRTVGPMFGQAAAPRFAVSSETGGHSRRPVLRMQ
ncbi:hypothetical protein, partial [Priestia megaterium]|uniref:hypothetical protein n=1 Tax=Priestia megaterium TaxID=1404 RepID=UPI0035B5F007